MIVKQIWTGKAYLNFNYLIACPESRWRRLRQPQGCHGTFQPAEVIVPHSLFREFRSLKKIRNKAPVQREPWLTRVT